MRVILGTSVIENSEEAVADACRKISAAQAFIVITSCEKLAAMCAALQRRFPQSVCIGTSGITFVQGSLQQDKSTTILAFTEDCKAEAGIITHLSTCPVTDIADFQQNVQNVGAGSGDTVCIEFCTGYEERLVTTMNSVLSKTQIGLIGGTVFGCPQDFKPQVSCGGRVFEDSCAYLLLKNTSGKAKIFRESIYGRRGSLKHIATRVNTELKELSELDGRPAADVYSGELGLTRDQLVDNVLQNPLGRIVGNENFIASVYEVKPNGALLNYKRINENDTVQVMQLLDYQQISAQTLKQIRSEFHSISAVFSVDCIYRYMLYTKKNFLNSYLNGMNSLGMHVGIVGGGEQYKNQHVNQTMVCAVFE